MIQANYDEDASEFLQNIFLSPVIDHNSWTIEINDNIDIINKMRTNLGHNDHEVTKKYIEALVVVYHCALYANHRNLSQSDFQNDQNGDFFKNCFYSTNYFQEQQFTK